MIAAMGAITLLSTAALAQQPVYVRAHFVGATSQTVELYKHSVRGPSYHVVQTTLAGEVPVEAGDVRTYRGTVCGHPGSHVFARKQSSGRYDVIAIWGGNKGRVGTGSEVVGCGSLAAPPAFSQSDSCGLSTEVPPLPCDSTLRYVEVGADVDSVHVSILLSQINGGNLCDVISEVEHEINAASFYYERDADLAHVVGRIVIRTPENDPYPFSERNAYVWLSVLRGEWMDACAEYGLGAAMVFAGRAHNTANAAYHNSICNPNLSFGVISRGATYQRRVTGVAHIMGLIWGGRICGYGGFDTVCDLPPYECDNCMVLYFNSPNGACSFGYRLGDCQIDLLQSKLDSACVFDAASVHQTAQVVANGMPVDDGDVVQMTPSPVMVGTPAQASFVYTNNSPCPVTMDASLAAGPGADWRVLDCSACPVVVPPGASRTFRVSVNSDWPATHTATLSIELAGPIVGRDYQLTLEYQTTTPVGVAPGPFSLQTPFDGAVFVQGNENCIDFTWTHSLYAERYELTLLRKYTLSVGIPGFQVLLSENIRFDERLELPTCATAPANDSPLDCIWVIRAVNQYGDRIVAYHPYNYHFPNGFGLNEPFIPSLRIVPASDESNCGPTPGGGCAGTITGGRYVLTYGDVTRDRCVNFDDLGVLYDNFGQSEQIAYPDGDLDLDGDVDRKDIDIMTRINLDCACRTFVGCGKILSVTQGGCYQFRADCGADLSIQNVGNSQIGDRIWVRGAIRSSDEFCFPAPSYPSIPNNEVGECVSVYGSLVQVGECVLLNAKGRYYEVENLGPYQVEDVVYVMGGVVQGAIPECPLELPITVISGNTITAIIR